MTLAKRAASAVFAREPHRCATHDERANSQRFACGPIDLIALVVQLGPVLKLAHQLWMRCEPFGVLGEVIENCVELGSLDSGFDVRQNAQRTRRLGHLDHFGGVCACLVERHLQLALEVDEHALGFLDGELAALHERLNVELANAATLGDCLVHQRLGVARIVAFVVSLAAITHHVDHDVFVEPLAIFEGHLSHTNTCLGVVAVHVEDRRLHGLGDVAAIQRTARKLGAGGEPNLVVDDEVDRATHAVAVDVAHRETLGHHTLTSERRVAMNQDWQRQIRPWRLDAVLVGAHHTQHDRVNRLEVAGVRCKLNFDLRATGTLVLAHCAKVILHVAGALH